MNTRPSWDDTYFAICNIIAQRSTCLRLHTACVIVDNDHTILSTGYNGSIRGLAHCTDEGCIVIDNHCKRAIHAELNAILNCARIGSAPLAGATAYVLHEPCMDCARALAQAGIKEVRYQQAYDNRSVHDFLREAKVRLVHVNL